MTQEKKSLLLKPETTVKSQAPTQMWAGFGSLPTIQTLIRHRKGILRANRLTRLEKGGLIVECDDLNEIRPL